ncbi:MAG TPA: hypothetical protein VGM54_02345 [Chthoniobacter sp.]|jgi:hypothetical protein
MKRWPLSVYVIAVIITLLIVNVAAWCTGGPAKFRIMEIYSSGFLMGMVAMYIAVHVYRCK